MNTKQFEELVSEAVRNNVPAVRVDQKGVRNGLYAVTAALLLLALLFLPFSILACKTMYRWMQLEEAIQKIQTKKPAPSP